MTKETIIAWVSRHHPLPAQKITLQEKLGKIKLVRVSRTFANAQEVMKEIKNTGAKYAVVVLPLGMIAQLLPLAKKEGVTLLLSEMEPPENHPGLPDQCPGAESCPVFNPLSDVWLPLHGSKFGRHLRFKRFSVIKEVKLVLEPF